MTKPAMAALISQHARATAEPLQGAFRHWLQDLRVLDEAETWAQIISK